jgi:hypothetical protein
MGEPAERTKVEMSAATAAALRERGGNVYVWADGAGMLRTSTNPPTGSIVYDRCFGEGWAVHVDREIEPPTRWVIERQRLPWPRFRALYDPPESEWSAPELGDIVEGILGGPWGR